MTNVSLTSLHAHQEQVVSGRAQTQTEKILDCLLSVDALTRRQISELSRLPINVVCARVDVLIKSGRAHVAYEDKDPGSLASSSQFIEATMPQPVQRSFAWPR